MTFNNYNQLSEISTSVGDSFYIFDRSRLIENYQHFTSSFKKYYKNTLVAYAYKANYAPFVVKTIKKMGALSEVVSTMEYDIALKCNVEPSNIIFNGPVKSKEDIKKAFINNSMLNLDSFYELIHIKSICHEDQFFQKLPKKVGIRLNLSIPDKPASRFGFTVDQLNVVLKKVNKIENLEIAGLHCHFSTRDKNPENYKLIAEKMMQIADTIFTDYAIEYLNVGGGFFGKIPNQLKSNFDGPIYETVEYAEAIAGTFKSAFGDEGPTLIIEPGVSLVGDTMSYYTRVLEIKKMQTLNFALTHGSILHIKPTGGNSIQPFEVIKRRDNNSNLYFNYNICGNTCMEHDILYNDYLGNLEIDDFLVFANKGAYTNVFKPPFIHYSPAIVEYINNKIIILKKSESVQNILETYLQ